MPIVSRYLMFSSSCCLSASFGFMFNGVRGGYLGFMEP